MSKKGKGKSTSLFVQEKFVAVSNITASSQQSERGNKWKKQAKNLLAKLKETRVCLICKCKCNKYFN